MSRTFTYPASLEPGDEGAIVVTFPDVPQAITEGDTRADALAQATDALGLALLVYIRQGLPLPEPSRVVAPLVAVSVEPDVAAKLAVLEAFQTSGLSKVELGRRMERDEKEVRRILDPMHPTKLPALKAALAVLGWRMVLSVEALEAA